MDWDDAIEEAKEEHGYFNNQYIKNWDDIIETAEDIYEEDQQNEYDSFCLNAQIQHINYLKSDRWQKIRSQVMSRDNYKCISCNQKAVEVHHLNYNYLYTDDEIHFCVSLCRRCHDKVHNIKK